jgi:hypothetical protein
MYASVERLESQIIEERILIRLSTERDNLFKVTVKAGLTASGFK